MVTLGFGRCELVSEDVPSSRLLGAARLWGVVLGRGNCEGGWCGV